MKKIFAINLGSTSTKVAYYEDKNCICRDSISHNVAELNVYKNVFEQFRYRKNTILNYMHEHRINLDDLDALVSRGGQTEPIPGGVYEINDAMLRQAESGYYGIHVCSVGCRIAYDLCQERKAVPLTVDVPTTDEFDEIARFSGLPEIERKPCFQALNQKAMAKYYAKTIGKLYEDLNLIVVMLGGGVSVVAHRQGRMVDGPNALEGDGSFSNNRCGSVPVGDIIRMCYSGEYTREEMLYHINGNAGLLAYLGTIDVKLIEEQSQEGDQKSKTVIEAMCYQIAKEIGAYSTVLKGKVDAILFTGGMANSKMITDLIKDRVSFIATTVVIPGEREMEALCMRSYDALNGREEIHTFIPGDKVMAPN